VRLALQIALMVALAGLFALLHALALGPGAFQRVAQEGAVLVDDALGMDPVLWVDARSLEAFEQAHVAGAVRLTEDNWEAGLGELLLLWDPGTIILVYCDGAGCAASRQVAERLRRELGVEDAYWIEDGWEALEQRRLP
jgi:rhodanese-related sulfurtransferase